jgi:hypothetical protein
MSKIVFILGAGASVHAGAPLMGNFLDVASDLYWNNRTDNKKIDFERVFNVIGKLQAVHSKAQLDLNNIESIFTALELGKIIKRVPGTESSEIPNVIASLKELIVKTLETTINFPVINNNIHAPSQYQKFAKLIKFLLTEALPKQSVSVLSFNYDICVDVALIKENLTPNYMIGQSNIRYEAVDLLKLHGSLNWATEIETRKIVPLHLHDYFKQWSYHFIAGEKQIMLPIGSGLAGFFKNNGKVPVDPEPVIVPPSWNKADYHQALSDVWAKAAEHLSEAENIFIIGYSLPETDSFFRHLYALGSVGSSTLRRIIVFNPDQSGETDRRFRALLGPGSTARYEYRETTFEGAIGGIQNLFARR